MHALVRAVASLAALAGLSALLPPTPLPAPVEGAVERLPARPASPASTALTGGKAGPAVCPTGMVPDQRDAPRPACVPLPPSDRPLRAARRRRLGLRPPALIRLRPSTGDEHIPRLPGRSERYADYRWPVDPLEPVLPARPSGLPDELEEALDEPRWSGGEPAGVRIETEPEAEVRLLALDGQVGAATVQLVGQLYGVTVVTRHSRQAPAGPRDYLVFHGHLSRPGPQVVNGASVEAGAVLGYTGDLDGSDSPHLYLEVRQVRRGAELGDGHLSDLVRATVSIPTDPRNALPLQ